MARAKKSPAQTAAQSAPARTRRTKAQIAAANEIAASFAAFGLKVTVK